MPTSDTTNVKSLNQKINVSALLKLKRGTTSDLCKYFKLSDEANNFLSSTPEPKDFLQMLIDKEQYIDAVNFLAHNLPLRESIWWGYLAAFYSDANSENKEILTALQIVKDWVYKPDEKLRRDAEEISEKLQFKNASGWIATAIFWSGGSLCKENAPQVLPADGLYAKAVAGCIMLAAVLNSKSVEESHNNYHRFLIQGIDIVNGGNGNSIN